MTQRSMRLLRAFSSTAWAITPEKLQAICEFIEIRATGGRLSKAEVRAITQSRQDRDKEMRGGVLVLPVLGTITQRAGLLSEYSGGTSTEKLGAQIERAAASGDVRAIILDIDSPGGNVEGVPELASKIFAVRGQKPIIAVVNSLMASAAYWVGSACDEVVITPSGLAGSIGVFAVHTEFSKALDDMGVATTIIRAGRFKAEASPFEPLTDDAQAHLQEMVDQYYDDFSTDVARFRGTTPAAVRNGYGEGRVLTADSAVAAGLADRVGTIDEVLAEHGVDGGQLAAERARIATEVQQQLAARANTEHVRPAAWAPQVEILSSESGLSVPVLLRAQEDDQENEDEERERDCELSADLEAGGQDVDEHEAAAKNAEEQRPDVSHPPHNPATPAEEGTTMSKDTAAPGGAGTITVGADATAAETRRAADIVAICGQHDMMERAQEWINEGISADVAGRRILDGQFEALKSTRPSRIVDMDAKDERRYSVTRAIMAAADNDWKSASLEREVSLELGRKLNRKSSDGEGNGFSVMVPTALSPLPKKFRGVDDELARPRAQLVTGTPTAGQELVFTEPGSFIDMLRNRMVTTRLGATFLPGLQGNVSFPKQTGAGTFEWRAEDPGTDVSFSDLVTGQVMLQPNDGTSATSFSRRLLAQSVVNVEQLVRRDLASIGAIGVDFAALHGPGGNAPTGIYDQAGVNAVAFGGPINWEAVVEMETAIVASNADIGTMAYAATPEVRGDGKTTEMFPASNGMPIWTGGVDGGEMNGFRAMASNQLRKDLGVGTDEHGMIFGVWEHLLIGEWGALELIIDPFTLARQGLIIVVLYLIADTAVRYPEAFSIATGLTA